MPSATSTTRGLVEGALAKEGLSPQIALEVGGWEVVKRYVALGAGEIGHSRLAHRTGSARSYNWWAVKDSNLGPAD